MTRQHAKNRAGSVFTYAMKYVVTMLHGLDLAYNELRRLLTSAW